MGALARPTRKEHKDTCGDAELLLLGGKPLHELPVLTQETIVGGNPEGVKMLKKAKINTRPTL